VTRVRVLHHVGADSLSALRAAFPEVEFVPVTARDPLGDEIHGEVLFTTAIGGPGIDEILTRGVRWIHTLGTGVDRFPLHAVRPGQILTCSRGASAIPISEWVLATMLTFEKRLPEVWDEVSPEGWFRASLGGLFGRRLAVLGMGSIGTEVARRARAFGMEVRGLRRTPRPVDVDGVGIVATAAEAVDGAHHVVIAAPATSNTRHLVDAALLAQMRPGVHLVNIARGSLIDQDALREYLDAGHVARASLDVAEPEPLPAGHWLYEHPAVRLSPHISWSMPESNDLLYETFRANLVRWLKGEELDGIVDIDAGY
jgi:phosphoglycerate dehydrogenase-like enzyme